MQIQKSIWNYYLVNFNYFVGILKKNVEIRSHTWCMSLYTGTHLYGEVCKVCRRRVPRENELCRWDEELKALLNAASGQFLIFP